MPTENYRIYDPKEQETLRNNKQEASHTPILKAKQRGRKGLPPLGARTVELDATHKSQDFLKPMLQKRGISPSGSAASLSTGYTSDTTDTLIRIDTGKPSLFAKDGDTKTVLNDFTILRMIGKGSYGKVYLIERKGTPGDVYAMKVMQKTKIIEEDLLEGAKLENEIL